VELPKRKNPRLSQFDYSLPGAYFVTICTKDMMQVLGNIIVGGDALIAPQMNLSSVGIIVDKYIKNIPGIHKYVIMPNHLHMIIIIGNGAMRASPPTQSIPSRIRSFKKMVAREIGVSIFQRSFHDHIIRGEQDYRKIWEYIDTNVIRWQNDCFYTE